MSICREHNTSHLYHARVKNALPGLWRREAKLQVLDPGVGDSLSVAEH